MYRIMKKMTSSLLNNQKKYVFQNVREMLISIYSWLFCNRICWKKKKEKEKLPYLKLKSLAFYTFSVN